MNEHQQLTGGAEKIIEDLFKENFHSLVFSSFRLVKDYGMAEDIVQNIFVKIWQDYEKIKHISKLKHYLYKAVRNSSLNYLRDQKLINKENLQIETLNIEVSADPDNEKDDTDFSNKIHQAVDKLPDKWREAFILSKYEKLKYYEIAEKMKISDKTVEKYISKALAFLRVELKHMMLLIIYIFFFDKV